MPHNSLATNQINFTFDHAFESEQNVFVQHGEKKESKERLEGRVY